MGFIELIKQLFFGSKPAAEDKDQFSISDRLQPTPSAKVESDYSDDSVSTPSVIEIRELKPFSLAQYVDAEKVAKSATSEPTNDFSPPNPPQEEASGAPRSAWYAGNEDIICGLTFCATLQLRTPLRILLRHGDVHTDRSTMPPQVTVDDWEGVWVPKLRTFSEILGVKVPEIEEVCPNEHASDVGPILPRDYLPFLVAVRKVVESEDNMQVRIDNLRKMLSECDWQNVIEKHGGIEKIVQFFFPRRIRPMPKFSASTKEELVRMGIDQPSSMANATDTLLLSVKGIGPAKLLAIREHCEDIAKPRDAERIDSVRK